MRKPLGGWAVWSTSLFEWVGNARYVRLVVPVLVVLAWFERSWCGLLVVLRVIVCWLWF